MVTESRPTPVPYSILLPKPKPDSPMNSPMAVTRHAEVDKPATKKPKPKTGANSKGKKNARLISRMARNKPKPPVKLEPIVVNEDSDFEVERFLADEYPYSEGLCNKPPYDFVKNLPPCLRDNPDFPGIEPPHETLGESSKHLDCSTCCCTLRSVWVMVGKILLGCTYVAIQNPRFGKPSGKAHWSECKGATLREEATNHGFDPVQKC
jgi:hypothetical protein